MRSFGFKPINATSIIAAIFISLFLTIGSFAEDTGTVVQASGSKGTTSDPNPSGITGGTESNPISSPMESSTMYSPRRGGRAGY